MMGVYERYILPRLTHWACSGRDINRQRLKIVPLASGKILEVGMGSGLNLPFYDPAKVDRLWGVDPCRQLRNMAMKKAVKLPFAVDFIGLSGEEIPLEDKAADSVLMTYTLCSIPDPVKALKEMNRVLRPGGKLIFCEHGRAPDKKVHKWQNRINPAWNKISGGCNLNRTVLQLLEEGGFKVEHLETGYNSPIKILSYNYCGVAARG